ncbi:hypothetical protein I4J35_12075 [Corynebacterium belfantii]|uniref:hypothetical protein n=1 Tax=Corynebacterium belfantii TaxID=2014537 RepID=UPI0018D4A3B1|nr:hypothetical protein [Corynebacterium belfantii]MBG9329506.1 hypothetical protein [Corynebacterium belfantii]
MDRRARTRRGNGVCDTGGLDTASKQRDFCTPPHVMTGATFGKDFMYVYRWALYFRPYRVRVVDYSVMAMWTCGSKRKKRWVDNTVPANGKIVG